MNQTKKFWKITNEKECHNGYQYQDGLNVLYEPFNDDPEASRVKGGLYFTDEENICFFLDRGVFLREVILPTNFRELKVIVDSERNEWRANMIYFGKKYDLRDICINEVIDNDNFNGKWLMWAMTYGHFKVVKFLLEKNDRFVNQQTLNMLLLGAVSYGYFEIVKYLVELRESQFINSNNCSANRINNKFRDDMLIKTASINNNWQIVKYLTNR